MVTWRGSCTGARQGCGSCMTVPVEHLSCEHMCVRPQQQQEKQERQGDGCVAASGCASPASAARVAAAARPLFACPSCAAAAAHLQPAALASGAFIRCSMVPDIRSLWRLPGSCTQQLSRSGHLRALLQCSPSLVLQCSSQEALASAGQVRVSSVSLGLHVMDRHQANAL